MIEPALSMSGELAEALAENQQLSRVETDTRTMPVRNSHLKAMGRSAAHCHYSMLHDWEPTLSMRLGTGAHALLLGGPQIVTFPGKVRNGKVWDAFKVEHADAIILSESEARKAKSIAAAVRADEVANRVLFAEGMNYERTILWEQLGRTRRCTPDAFNKSIIVDLKTTRDASPERFRWDAIRMGYHVQLADYALAFEAHHGYPPKDCYIVAVENTAPYGCSTWRLTTAALDKGRRLAGEWLAQLIACEASGVWPGYSTGVIDFDVPMDEADLFFADDEDENEEEQS